LLILVSLPAIAQPLKNNVKIVGQMKDVMWNGQLYGKINPDTITNKEHLYGFGPVAYLAGEILIIDGRCYRSTVLTGTTMKVEETYQLQAPFFGYANINQWNEQVLPDSVQTIRQLEEYLDGITKKSPRPFLFKLTGIAAQATIHIKHLPKGATVRKPADAQKGQKKYELSNAPCDIIGFFSTEHQAIFTHHDTYLHMHLITADRQQMGHLDDVVLKRGAMKLYLPAE